MSCNAEKCKCPKECEFHGKCCECINNHIENGVTVHCMSYNDPTYWQNHDKQS